MLFEEKKLGVESKKDLLTCEVRSIEPFTLMLAPIYVFMKVNQKFVSVKAPLDFFTQEELDRFQKYEVFYVPKFVKKSVQFETSASLVRAFLEKASEHPPVETGDAQLPMTPFEIQNEVLRMTQKLWGRQVRMEPFFMSVFANEFCGPLDAELMLKAREEAVIQHDLGLLLSGSYVFLGICLDEIHMEKLNERRREIYTRTVNGEDWSQPRSEWEYRVQGISKLILDQKWVDCDSLYSIRQDWASRLAARLKRMKTMVAKRQESSPTIYGEEGFAA